MLINKSIHALIENDPSTSVSVLISHIKSTEGYTTTYRKTWLTKKKAIENIYNNWERSFHDLSRFVASYATIFPGMVVEKEILPMPPQGGQTVEGFVKFHSLFWSFGSCIDGFQYCKPMVQVDETWLYRSTRRSSLWQSHKMTTIKSFQ